MPGSNLRCLFFRLVLPIALHLSGCAPAATVTSFQPPYTQIQQARLRKITRFSGLVLDSISRKPIPSVLVNLGYYFEGFYYPYWYQAYTDKQGRFGFSIDDMGNLTPGYLTVNTLYFEGKTAAVDSCSKDRTILLHRNKYQLPGSSCWNQADTIHANPYSSPLVFALPGNQFAFYIENKTGRATDTLRTIGFYTGKQGFYKGEQARLRIYRAGSIGQPPGEDLLTENVMLWCISPNEAWYTIDMKEFNILVPSEGAFVALEMITGTDGFVGCSPSIEGYTPIGTMLRPPCAFAATRLWSYNNGSRTVEARWERVSASQNAWPVYENAIRLEVSRPK